jgi:CzcA family heavy metal efflux pump
MFAHLIRFSLTYRGLVVVAAVVVSIAGLYTATTMPIDVFPDLTAPMVAVVTEATGMTPTEVENVVTFPIEVAMNGAPGVRRVRSSTALGISIVWVEFEWGTPIAIARQTVNERLNLVRSSLPPGVEAPLISPQSSVMGEILFIALESQSRSLFDVRTVADTVVRRRLLSIPGVSHVVPIGGEVKQYQVILSPARLQAYQIGSADVARALAETNENASAGLLVRGGQEFIIQGQGRVHALENIADTVVVTRSEVPIRVGQLGTVQIGPALKRGEASAMARPAVVMGVMKQPSVNTLELTARIDAALDDIASTLPPGITIRRDLFRQADFIELAVRNIEEALRDGGLLVVVIVTLFLWNARASAITLTAIPLSLLTTILVLKAFGATINTMTLGGMAIAIGELVDDAIVDVENVVRRLRENSDLPPEERRSAMRVIFEASVEIRSSIVFATLIVTLVFLPLFFLSGVEGRLLKPLAVAYIVSLLVSLLVAVTLTPALCSLLLPKSKGIRLHRQSPIANFCKRWYRPVLEHVIDRPRLVGGIALAFLLAALAYLPFAGRSFLPEFNEGALTIEAFTPPGTSLADSDATARELERALLKFPEVISVGRRTGRAERDEHAMGVEASELDVRLKLDEGGRSKEQLLAAIRRELAQVPGVQVAIGQPISHRIDHMLSGTRSAIAIKIFAPESDPGSLPKLRQLGAQVKNLIADVPGVVDLAVAQQADVPQVHVNFDRQAIARHGLRIRDVSLEIERAFAGEAVSRVLEGRNAFDLVVRCSQPRHIEMREILELPVTTSTGAKVPLRSLANIHEDRGPNTISREKVQRKLVVSCNAAGRDVGSVVADIQMRLARGLPLASPAYRGYYVEYGGQFETARSTQRLLLMLGAAVVVGIALVLQVAFHSTRDALLIMLNLPLALIGGVAGLHVSGGVISIATLVGFITLLGIATRNGIMLVAHIRHLQRHEGEFDFRAAVIRGAMERLVPILMTALCAGLALVPLTLSGGRPGNEIQTPLAIVVLFGLLSSTALNMLVVPALFLHLADPRPPTEVDAAAAELRSYAAESALAVRT